MPRPERIKGIPGVQQQNCRIRVQSCHPQSESNTIYNPESNFVKLLCLLKSHLRRTGRRT
uniref:Uncharacterized protein n=1 Tax=Arundo donax TaxID=35708 RepID=A0A0A9AAF7_ARUDO